jgi:hypothetical protein
MSENHDWDRDGADTAYEKKFEEWEKRDWPKWLAQNLTLPFKALREDDDDDAIFTDAADDLFRLHHKMEVVGIDEDDVNDGIIVEVKEKGETGYVPLSDLQVKPKTDKNFWPVREYAVWFANRF